MNQTTLQFHTDWQNNDIPLQQKRNKFSFKISQRAKLIQEQLTKAVKLNSCSSLNTQLKFKCKLQKERYLFEEQYLRN